MNNFFDIRTVLFSSIITSAICAIVMNSLWWQNRRRSPELGFWQADFILQFAAILLIALRGILPDVISVLLGVPFILLGALLMLLGLERYTGKPSARRYNFILLAVFSLVHGYFSFVHPSLLVRNINQSVGLLVFCGQCAWLLLRRVDSAMWPDTRPVGLIFTAYSLVSFIRIFVDLIVPHETDLFKSGLYDTLAILIYQMLFIGLTFALFLMVNRRLFTELERDIAERKMAEAALHISEEKFSVAFQNTPDALVITLLPDGKIIEANESFFRMSGFSKAESLGRTTVSLNLWGDLADRNQMVETLRQQHRVLNLETDFRKKSGDLFRGSISGELIQLQGQTCVLNIIRDITERKQAEEALRVREEYYRALIENGSDAITLMGEQGTIQYISPSTVRILGWTLEERAGKDGLELVHPEDVEYLHARISELQKIPGGSLNAEYRLRHKDGTWRMIEATATNLLHNPSVRGIVTNYRDVTERKQAEEALRESEQKYRLLFDEMLSGLAVHEIICDQSGTPVDYRFLAVNAAFERVTGLKAADLLGKTVKEIMPGTEPFWIERYGRVALTREAAQFENYSGVLGKHFEVRAFSPEPGKFATIFNDITERKQAEVTLRESEERFRRAVLGAPFPIMLHAEDGEVVTINTPWTQLTGYEHSDIPTIADWTKKAYGTRMDLVRADIDSLYALDGPKAEGEYTIMTRSGQTRTWDFSSAPIGQLPDGRRLVISMAMDVTERKQAEDALRESENKFKYVFEYSVVGKSITQISGGMQVNKALCDMLGYSLQEMQEKKWQEITHPDDIELTKSHVELLVSGKQDSTRFVKRFIHKNGSIVWVDLSSTIRRDKQNKPLYLMSAVIDITERIQAAEKLRETNDYLENLFNYANAPIIVWDPRFKITRFNHAFETLTGRSAAEVLGKPLGILFPPAQIEASMELIQKTQTGERWEVVEINIQHFDGSIHTVLWNSATLFSEDGKIPIATIAQGQDITERKQAEEKLIASEIRYRRLFEVAKDGIMILDAETGMITDANPFLIAMLGFSHEAFLGKKIWDLGLFKDIVASQANFLELQQKDYIRYEDLPLETADGRRLDVEFIGNVYQAGHGKVFQCNIRDITERKRMEQALQEYNARLETEVEQRTRELRAAQEQLVRQERLAMLGQVAGSIGHELRNPLGVISNAVYYLKMSQPEASDKVKEYLDILEKETRTSDKIVTDLLDFARIKTLDREPAAVSELIHQTMKRYPAPRSVQVALEIPAGLPKIFADPQHVVQVLGNLLVNAYQAMEKQPGLKRTASLREQAGSTGTLANRKLTVSAVAQGDMMILAVQDTGTGISPENMDKLFEPLFTTKARGIGLGLAVSRKLVEANGGKIEVQSEPGRGSVFTIYLPIHQEFK
jgi:PAS domain S-box-containing protein